MKKLLNLSLGLGLLLGITTFGTSCNKKGDWNCKCTVNGNEETYTIHDKKRKDAEAECNKSGSVLGVDYSCKIKYL